MKQRTNHKVRESIDLVEKACSRSRSPKRPVQKGEHTSGGRTLGGSPLRLIPNEEKKRHWIPCK